MIRRIEIISSADAFKFQKALQAFYDDKRNKNVTPHFVQTIATVEGKVYIYHTCYLTFIRDGKE